MSACKLCDGDLHVPTEDGLGFKRCPECFPKSRQFKIINVPNRFSSASFEQVKKSIADIECVKAANSIVAKASLREELKKTPLFIGHEEHTLMLTAAIMNEVSLRSTVDCAMLTLGRLQHAFFNDKDANFYRYTENEYELISVQIGCEIVNGASSHVLREFLSERRNRGNNSIVISEVPPKTMSKEGFPSDMTKLLQDTLRFLPLEVQIVVPGNV